jgi:hypothetical protein
MAFQKILLGLPGGTGTKNITLQLAGMQKGKKYASFSYTIRNVPAK